MLAVPTAFGLVPARADDKTLVWGKAVDGFQMAMSLESARRLPSGAPAIRLHFRNVDDNGGIDVRLNLKCERLEGYRSDLLTLLLKDSSGKSERLADTALCFGGEYFQVPIPVGAAYSMPVNFDYYRAITESGRARDLESPGHAKDAYTLHAVLTADLGQEIVTLTSNDLVIGGSNPPVMDQGEPDWGAAVNDLQIAISLGPAADPPSPLPAITLHLRDVGASDLGVGLGSGCWRVTDGMLANGVILNLKDSSGNSKQLTDPGPGPPYPGGCAGGVWIFDIGISPGEVYSVPLKLKHYKTSTYSSIKRDFEPGWEPGKTYTLQAVLKAEPRYGTVPQRGIIGQWWAGTIISQGLEVHFPTQ